MAKYKTGITYIRQRVFAGAQRRCDLKVKFIGYGSVSVSACPDKDAGTEDPGIRRAANSFCLQYDTAATVFRQRFPGMLGPREHVNSVERTQELSSMKHRRNFVSLAFLLSVSACACFAGETATLRNGFTIHYQRRELRGEVARLYILESTDSFVDVPTEDILEIETDTAPPAAPKAKPETGRPAHPINLEEALSAASNRYHVSPDLLRSVIRAESGFNPNARSVKGAQGLMQLMPETAARMGVRNAMDPEENLQGGARFLRELLGRYKNDLPKALAAYNAGPERVEQYHGVPPYPETIAYVMRVLRGLEMEKPVGRRSTTAKGARHPMVDGSRTAGSNPSVVAPRAATAPDAPSADSVQTGDGE
jgi:hypothetical protein